MVQDLNFPWGFGIQDVRVKEGFSGVGFEGVEGSSGFRDPI